MNIETVIRASEPELHSQDQQPGDRVGMAIDIIAAGGMVIVVDDDSRENEGDLIASAETITPQMVAFMVNHSTGILCASMSGARADALHLPPMVTRNDDPQGTAYTVSCDAAACGTGVSAADRTLSFHALAAGATDPAALRRPGHIFPLRAREGGVLTREGHTEAAFDLVRLAGHLPVGVLCELVNRDGTMMAGPQIDRFAERHGLLKVSVAELIAWRRQRGDL
ncbi:3,4-dihydroxy-2-butanone-4-phosphate synthase [Paracoccus denitrificans]|jgi:3,4-dihydroxy 2-butanone 4-phosphate synthase/GTP cyclohydrolase II|uniref:3,4-dihydroxy-2-butanone 4-phosphate synthase n=1 Tax=Paracoccus denitrificans (strain Pd 1222) TaxID=318586 RepID=A1AYH4_PARDP|nr:3,4-dihydroxy-2-butanone-4-phosphate synthase [Paracoccus denitrificans]ABL68318.1 3,4-dihydroxy-2-butanone 4-phosphate synthase [Paracoccus denitrificans PD1222]MBB4627834.1 3,4-dihydroxy 2-butanone 4-phosphate synthase/GTP cyclohydrolase II [Paracoccus denitrificans]MCU7428631.1 3,4-dihydroxy-2-butanone-4-phosphate synthase [Paracoccus denitrificans]QAR26406.1 3,4-dihydroxy-2-butanone-4-phosphate synthase [Paracoccus denitrificans]UPV95337.1 3,4-dihydroxy-2-butanone-4-phosphate synthase [